MHTINIGRSSYLIPSKWDELNEKQLKQMTKLIQLNHDPIDLAKILFLIQTLSLPWWQKIKLQYFYFFQANTEERGDLLYCTRSFEEFRMITSQKIKYIRCTFVRLYGPDSGLANCTFWEYIKAEQYFLNYLEKKDPIWLDKLVAVLYRPSIEKFNPSIHEDRRIPLNDVSVRYRTKQMEKVSAETKVAVLIWFDGCRSSLIKNFPIVFKKPSATQNTQSPKAQSGAASQSWMNLISELAGSMDNYEKIGATNLYTALTDISHRIKKSQDLARQHAAALKKKK
jgi:hypothetical protein